MRGDYYRPDADDARSLLVRMREATERAGFDLFAGSYWDGLADLAEWEGDLGAALTHVDEALRSQRHSSGSKPAFWYRAHAAGLALEAGEVDRAEAIFATVDPALGDKVDVVVRTRPAHRGDPPRPRRRPALRRRAGRGRRRAASGIDPQLVHDLVRAMLLGGTPHEEVHEIFDLLPVGFGHGSLEDDPYRMLARAQLLEARGDDELALGGLRGGDRPRR